MTIRSFFPTLLVALTVSSLISSSAQASECRIDAPSATLQLLAFDADGSPLANLPVAFAGPAAGADTAYHTDEDGLVRLPVPPCPLRLVVGPEGVTLPALDAPPLVPRPGTLVELFLTSAHHTGDDDVTYTLLADGVVDPADRGTPGDREDEVPSNDTSNDPSNDPSNDTAGDRAPRTPRPLVVVVRRDDDDSPIVDAEVLVAGADRRCRTDEGGRCTVEVHDDDALSVLRLGFSPAVVRDLGGDNDDGADGVERVVRLTPSAAVLDDVRVRVPYIEGGLASVGAERRTQQQVVEVIGADQMRKSGDSDAASALKRATGLTVVGGRYVYVRGLGDRYSATLLNGLAVPSPEPERRVVPLDMFPAGLLGSMVVQKSWSPDLGGDFGGGTVLLRTRTPPEKAFLRGGVSMQVRPGQTFTNAPQSPGSGLTAVTDLLGVDDGSRALPAAVREASDGQQLAEGNQFSPNGYSVAELEDFGQQLSRRYSPEYRLLPPGFGVNLTAGDSWQLPVIDARLGAVVAGTFSNDWQATSVERNSWVVGQGNTLQRTDHGTVIATDHSVNSGAMLALQLALPGDHVVDATTLFNHSTDDETRILDGFVQDVGANVRATRLRWVERTLFTQQLSGEHPLTSIFPDFLAHRLEWRAAYSLAAREEPDQRETRYDEDADGVYRLSDRPEGNQRLYSSLADHNLDGGLTWHLPLPTAWEGLSPTIDVGTAVNAKTREVDTRRFKYLQRGPDAFDPTVRALAPEEAFADKFQGEDGFLLGETTRNTDNYTGEQLIGGLFVAGGVKPWASLQLNGGVRLEGAHLLVRTFDLFAANGAAETAELNTVDVLPALSATWQLPESLVDHMQLRAASALTVSRPAFRELSPAVFTDVTGGRSRFGNPDLVAGSIAHGDLRWEWYPTPTESMSVALFGKRFTTPIERVIQSGSDQSITYENAAGATNVGVEAEARLSLATMLRPLPLDDTLTPAMPILERLSVAGNVAFIHSQVDLAEDGIQTSSSRPLAGQSPWVANLQLGYDDVDDEDWGASVAVLYNVFGPRITEVGVLGAPDVYEEPFHQLDLVWNQHLPGGFQLSVKAKNLLDLPSLRTQGGEVFQQVTLGRSVSVGLSFAL